MMRLQSKGVEIVIYEPTLKENTYLNHKVIHDFKEFKRVSDVILVNRIDSNLNDVMDKV